MRMLRGAKEQGHSPGEPKSESVYISGTANAQCYKSLLGIWFANRETEIQYNLPIGKLKRYVVEVPEFGSNGNQVVNDQRVAYSLSVSPLQEQRQG